MRLINIMHTLQFTFIIECLRKINNIIAIAQVQPLRIYSVGRKHDVNALCKQLYRLPLVAAARKHDILASFELSALLEKAYLVQILDIDNNLFPSGGNFVNQRKQTFDLVFGNGVNMLKPLRHFHKSDLIFTLKKFVFLFLITGLFFFRQIKAKVNIVQIIMFLQITLKNKRPHLFNQDLFVFGLRPLPRRTVVVWREISVEKLCFRHVQHRGMHKLNLRIEVNQPLRQRQTAQNQPVVKHVAHQQKTFGSSGFGIFNRNALVNDAKDPVTLSQRIKLQITDVRTGNALNRKKTDFLRQPLQILVNRLCVAVPA